MNIKRTIYAAFVVPIVFTLLSVSCIAAITDFQTIEATMSETVKKVSLFFLAYYLSWSVLYVALLYFLPNLAGTRMRGILTGALLASLLVPVATFISPLSVNSAGLLLLSMVMGTCGALAALMFLKISGDIR